MSSEQKQKIKNILELNKNLEEEFLNWNISYNKRADLIIFGADFPPGSFYVNTLDGMMIRVDSNNKIHGFAIENAKSFIKKHKEFLPLAYVIYPVRSRILFALYKLLIQPLEHRVDPLRETVSVSKNYLAGQVVCA